MMVIDAGAYNVSGVITALPGSTIDLINGGVMNDND